MGFRGAIGLFAFTSLFAMDGCFRSEPGVVDQIENAHKIMPQPPFHRFKQLPDREDVAFDDQTGRLCKTWSWKSIDRKSPDKFEELPECAEVYTVYPTGMSKFSPEAR